MEWGRIAEFDYEISTTGLVRSLRTGHLLSPWQGEYLQVSLCRDGEVFPRYVQVLMLETFVGARPVGMLALHRDDDKHNNVIENLYWGDHLDNMADELRNGHHFNANKQACKRGHALEEPNLVPSQTQRGFRSCLACLRALASSYHYGRKGDEAWIQDTADAKFAQIMGAA